MLILQYFIFLLSSRPTGVQGNPNFLSSLAYGRAPMPVWIVILAVQNLKPIAQSVILCDRIN
jgi:hypothetical protein